MLMPCVSQWWRMVRVATLATRYQTNRWLWLIVRLYASGLSQADASPAAARRSTSACASGGRRQTSPRGYRFRRSRRDDVPSEAPSPERDAPPQRLRVGHGGLGGLLDQRAGLVDAVPHVPQQHAADLPRLQVVDDPGADLAVLPVLDHVEPAAGLADGLVAVAEDVGPEVGRVAVGLLGAGHHLAGVLSGLLGVVDVLDAAAPEEGVGVRRDVARGVHVRVTGAQVLVHHHTVVDLEAGGLGEAGARENADADDGCV